MHSKQVLCFFSCIGVLVIPLTSAARAEAVVPKPVEQQADFWLWYSDYGDRNGEVFDPEDFEKLIDQDDQAAPSQPNEEMPEDVFNEQSTTDEGPKDPRLNAGKGEI